MRKKLLRKRFQSSIEKICNFRKSRIPGKMGVTVFWSKNDDVWGSQNLHKKCRARNEKGRWIPPELLLFRYPPPPPGSRVSRFLAISGNPMFLKSEWRLDVKFLKRFEKVFLTTKKIFMRKKNMEDQKYFAKIFLVFRKNSQRCVRSEKNIFIFCQGTAPATPHQQWFASANLENRVPRFLCRDASFRCVVPWCPSIFRDFIEIATKFGFFRKMAFLAKNRKIHNSSMEVDDWQTWSYSCGEVLETISRAAKK